MRGATPDLSHSAAAKCSSTSLHSDRLLPADPGLRQIARALYQEVADAPLICPHGHCEAGWFAQNAPFPNATNLLVTPDHYILRMLASQGISYEALGLQPKNDSSSKSDPRDVWRLFAEHYYLFRGTPSRVWMDHALYEILDVPDVLSAETADVAFDHINQKLSKPAFRPRALFDQFNIELLATTDAATASLADHKALKAEGFSGIIPTFRPDQLSNPLRPDFADAMKALADQTGEDIVKWQGFLSAVSMRRQAFIAQGATATDHGVLYPNTANLPVGRCQQLLDAALAKTITQEEATQFEAQMLFEMARMSVEDGLVMQIHAGSRRNYSTPIFETYGLDMGFDIPSPTVWVEGLKPMLDAFGFEPNFHVILYTLDETTYSRELAPLAGAFPSLTIGAPWWFLDSPGGMRRYRSALTETAGFYNTAGFVDDTRAFLSIPARHDMFRRVEAGNLARLVAEHTLGENEALEVMKALAVDLARRAYRIPAQESR